MDGEDPFILVNGHYYCWHCFLDLEAAGNGSTVTEAVEDTLKKLEQAKQQAKEEKEEELSDYELRCLVIQWKFDNEKRSRAQRRRNNNKPVF